MQQTHLQRMRQAAICFDVDYVSAESADFRGEHFFSTGAWEKFKLIGCADDSSIMHAAKSKISGIFEIKIQKFPSYHDTNLKHLAAKFVIKKDEGENIEWLSGTSIDLKDKTPFILVTHGNDFLESVASRRILSYNYVDDMRRLFEGCVAWIHCKNKVTVGYK